MYPHITVMIPKEKNVRDVHEILEKEAALQNDRPLVVQAIRKAQEAILKIQTDFPNLGGIAILATPDYALTATPSFEINTFIYRIDRAFFLRELGLDCNIV